MIHKEGYKTIIITLVGLCILNVIAAYYIPMEIISYAILGISLLFFLFILRFFRNPDRSITPNDKYVLCPADGKVVVIEETVEEEYFKDKRVQVSIFMSPHNVHVNRNPISGIIKYYKYHKGLFLVAFNPKSSTKNERTTVVYEHKNGVQLLVRQIAGAVARRIVSYVKENNSVVQGEDFGFIKFGSRVDVFFPIGTEIRVAMNQDVKGNKTVLAKISE